jgi:hypothetical protein
MADEFDDLLDAAMDDAGDDFDFDDLLDAAADDLAQESTPVTTATVTKGPARVASSNAPVSWQDALQILPVAERVRWATTIARDAEKIRLEGKRRAEADDGHGALAFSNFSNEYQAGYGQEQKKAPEGERNNFSLR